MGSGYRVFGAFEQLRVCEACPNAPSSVCLLQAESPHLFERRVADAKTSRDLAEAGLRELFLLDALDTGVEEVRVINYAC